jgi:hypothetical protein
MSIDMPLDLGLLIHARSVRRNEEPCRFSSVEVLKSFLDEIWHLHNSEMNIAPMTEDASNGSRLVAVIDDWLDKLAEADKASSSLRLNQRNKVGLGHSVMALQMVFLVPLAVCSLYNALMATALITIRTIAIDLSGGFREVAQRLFGLAGKASLCLGWILWTRLDRVVATANDGVSARSALAGHAQSVSMVAMKVADRLVFKALRAHFHGAIVS